jgi:hypothetical protein
MMRRIIFPLFLLFFCCKAMAQEEFVPPQAKLITRFPFIQLTGGIIILQAQIDNFSDTLNFVLDTGSGGISLDSATVAGKKFVATKSNRTIRGIAGMKTVSFTYGHTLKFPGMQTDSLAFHINDYDLLTSVYGLKIDGIIGYSFLRRYILRIDYDNQMLEIYSPGTFKYPRGGYLMKPNFSTLPQPVLTVEDGAQIVNRFIFDTGAGLCFLLSKDFIDDSSLLKKHKKLYPTQAEGLGGKKLMDVTVLKSISVGPYKFRKVPVYVFNDEYNVTSYPEMGGLIGNDLLRRFNVILNYPSQTIHLKPNSHFSESFDYSYTGLGIYQIDNEVTVVDIVKDSPGDEAGFQTGDIIFAVDNNFSRNIQVFKNLLQNVNARIKILILRDHKPMVLYMDVKNILR